MEATARWGIGGALALRFAMGGFHVMLLGRRVAVLEEIAAEVRQQGGLASSQVCDVTDDGSVKAAFSVAKAIGEVDIVIFNAGPPMPPGRSYGSFPAAHEVDPEYLQDAFNLGVTGCVRCCAESVPDMIERSRGTVLLSGATMALRGGAGFGCMAPVKFGLRALGQSMYQELAPKGVHVAHVLIDGVINSPNTKGWTEHPIDPAELADAYFQLHLQKPTVWSYEVQLSPSLGRLGQRL